ncbi:MAG TPA: hypothetical protein VIQ02_21070, partial [Jiangellaceae bacterium]
IGRDAAWFDGRSSSRVRDGRYPIREWAILGGEDGEVVSPTIALAAVMPMVHRDMNGPAVLDGMLRTLSGTRLTRIRQLPPARLMERLIPGYVLPSVGHSLRLPCLPNSEAASRLR